MKKYLPVLIGILITGAIIGIADVVLIFNDIPTISETILFYTINKKIVVAPIFIGILCGHFFLPNNLKLLKKWYLVPIVLICIMIIFQILTLILSIHPIILVVIGTISGTLFWNQKRIKDE